MAAGADRCSYHICSKKAEEEALSSASFPQSVQEPWNGATTVKATEKKATSSTA